MVAPLLIIAIGNESRGDDALAPLLLRRLQVIPEEIELLEDFQLQIEHAMDLLGRELVLFVDAGMDTPAPYSFYRIRQDAEPALFSHALAPQAVLATYTRIYHGEPPPAYVLCLRGEQFELGSPLSASGEQHLEQALHLLQQRLLQETTAAAWDAQAAQH